jgi:hypothetical protein
LLTKALSTNSPKSAGSVAASASERYGRREWLTQLGIGSALLTMGCAAATLPGEPATRPARAVPRAPKTSRSDELTSFVPAAGLEWMLVTDPRATYAKLRPFGVEFLRDQRLDAFAEHTGLDLRSCTQAVVAGYVDSTLYVTRADGGSARVAASLKRRDSGPSPAVTSADAASGDSVPSRQETFFALDADVCAVAIGNPLPAKAARLFARGQLKRSQPALAGSSLQQLPRRAHQGLLRLYAPGPLTASEHPLLQRVHAASLSFDIVGKRLVGRAYAVGEFSAEEDAQLRTFVEQVLRSELASLLMLDTPAGELRSTHEENACLFESDWDAEQVLAATVGVLEARISAVFADPKATNVSN